MNEVQDKKRKQELGSFYTDRKIVEFIFDILNIWKDTEDKKNKRWQSNVGGPHFPSVIDPAVGEGAFLKVALEKDFTNPAHIFGMDIDENAVNQWPDTHLLNAFDNRISTMQAHFFSQNGLDRIRWEQHENYYKKHLKNSDYKKQEFDAVVGNPPYGGTGITEDQLADETFLDELKSFELLPIEIKKELQELCPKKQLPLDMGFEISKKDQIKNKVLQRLKSFPIEVLFIEKFIKLAKPQRSGKTGAKIAIVIPDGILANSNMHNVREFIAKKTKVNAIVSLPRDAFKNVGTNAKTSILFLQKLKKEADLTKDLDYPVFLASIAGIEQNNFDILYKSYKNFFEKGALND